MPLLTNVLKYALKRRKKVTSLENELNSKMIITSSHRGVSLEVIAFWSRDYKGDREGIPHIHPIP